MLPDYINSINLKRSDNWLFLIGIGLALNHLSLTWKLDQVQLIGNSLLFWGAILWLIWRKRHSLNWQSQPLSTSIGLFLVGFILFRTASISENNFFLRIYPLISLIAWSLLASGIGGIKQYLKELVIVCCLVLDSTFMTSIFDISAITAKFSGYLLWYIGFPVTLQGVNIIMPSGSVEVNSGCSGYTIMLQLVGLSIIFISLFPSTKIQTISLPIAAIVMGFTINVIRVGLMAVLVAANQKEAFTYWHQEDGSLIFSVIGVVLFSWFYNFWNRDNWQSSQEEE